MKKRDIDVIDAIYERKSIRGFLATPVPKEVLLEILKTAVRAPSSENLQPWKFYVLGGEAIKTLKDKVKNQIESGKPPEPEFPLYTTKDLPKKYRSRTVELGKTLFGLIGIERHDMEGRKLWYFKMMQFFNAPNAIIITVDEKISNFSSTFSIGCATMAFTLAALPYGLGSCILHAGVFYPKVVREVASIPHNEKVMMSIAVGYPDMNFKGNSLESTRVPEKEVVTFIGF